MSHARRASFIVRVVQCRQGRVSGVIERVATGAKEAFTSLSEIGPVISRMLHRERGHPPASAGRVLEYHDEQ